MPNVSPKRHDGWLQIRSDPELRADLREVQGPWRIVKGKERPTKQASDVIRELLAEAAQQKRAKAKRA